MESSSDIRSASHPLNRRTLLAGLLAFGGTASTSTFAAGDELASVRSKRHPLLRIRIEMDVKGNVNLASNPLDAESEKKALPISSVATLDYEERPLAPRDAAEMSEVVAGQRYYHEAKSSSVLNETKLEKSLREPLRHVVVHRETLPETLFSEENYFTQDELALLRSPVSSLAVDQLLPEESVAVGDRYEIKREALSSVLNLTSVDSGAVESEVTEVTAKSIRFALEGEFEASIDGVSTRMRLIGKLTFDRRYSTCTWLALALHETREIGKAEPGFDIAATIRMVRRPMEKPVALPAKVATVPFGTPVPDRRLFVELQCREIPVGAMMRRNWRKVQDVPGTAVIRRIDHETNVAQCNLRSLVRLPGKATLSLAEFEADVRRTLGDQLTQIMPGDERVTAQGLKMLRVVADGESGGVPLRWIMLHFSDDAGRRVQATFTMSADRAKQFGADDFQLADSLRFLPPERTPGETPSENAEEVAGRLLEPAARVAGKKAGNSSPSDLD
ncbi:MAG: hypothetical protein AAFX06_10505 [Planctomycetota bacterium]